MSYTFSRRDFMKYTALTAVAVASAGMFTGCGENPNQPSAVFNNADAPLSFGGTSGGFLGIGASHDKHVLLKEGTSYDGTTLKCAFAHTPVTEGTSCTNSNYQIVIVTSNGPLYRTNGNNGVTIQGSNPSGSIKVNDKNITLPVKNTLTIKGLPLDDVDKLYIQYFPRHNALGNESDTYSDVFATWDITSLVKG